MRPVGGCEGYKVGLSYSSALQLLPLQHTATLLYSTATTTTTKTVAERANSSGGTLRRSEEKRKRPLSRNTKQPPTVPHHYSACRAQMLTTERIAVRHKEGVKINSFIRASHFSPSSRKRKKKKIFVEIINQFKKFWFLRKFQYFRRTVNFFLQRITNNIRYET